MRALSWSSSIHLVTGVGRCSRMWEGEEGGRRMQEGEKGGRRVRRVGGG